MRTRTAGGSRTSDPYSSWRCTCSQWSHKDRRFVVRRQALRTHRAAHNSPEACARAQGTRAAHGGRAHAQPPATRRHWPLRCQHRRWSLPRLCCGARSRTLFHLQHRIGCGVAPSRPWPRVQPLPTRHRQGQRRRWDRFRAPRPRCGTVAAAAAVACHASWALQWPAQLARLGPAAWLRHEQLLPQTRQQSQVCHARHGRGAPPTRWTYGSSRWPASGAGRQAAPRRNTCTIRHAGEYI